jgi:hypothetical protein
MSAGSPIVIIGILGIDAINRTLESQRGSRSGAAKLPHVALALTF